MQSIVPRPRGLPPQSKQPGIPAQQVFWSATFCIHSDCTPDHSGMWSKHRRKVPICSIGKGGKTRERNYAIGWEPPVQNHLKIYRGCPLTIKKMTLWAYKSTDAIHHDRKQQTKDWPFDNDYGIECLLVEISRNQSFPILRVLLPITMGFQISQMNK